MSNEYTRIPLYVEIEGTPREAYARLHNMLQPTASKHLLGWGSELPGAEARWLWTIDERSNMELPVGVVENVITASFIDIFTGERLI
jgi:hypothetical protein